MTLAHQLELVFVILGAALALYALTGGADFGGGFWDLLARGERKERTRAAIEHAIAPIWEANHVWLIFIIVVTFTVFPRAFAIIGTALHIPLFLALLGIVARGAAFTFRAYGLSPSADRERWGHVFAWASALTPMLFGLALGSLASGDIRLSEGRVISGFFSGWTGPLAGAVGVLALGLCALLAAVYLTLETEDLLQEDFRRRGLFAAAAVSSLLPITAGAAALDAPGFFDKLARSDLSPALGGAALVTAASTFVFLERRRYRAARISAAALVITVIFGFGFAMDGHLVIPDLPLQEAGAQPEILGPLLVILLIGAALVAPALYYLFRIFKSVR